MTTAKRFYLVAGLLAVLAIAAALVTLSSQLTSADDPPATGEAARLDDGGSLLPQAGISIDDAIAAAQAAVANPGANDGDGETNDDGDGADDHADDEDNDDSDAEDDGDVEEDSPPAGEVGEIDLENYNGTLVFNVEIGNQDVKVDAQTGDVLGMGSD